MRRLLLIAALLLLATAAAAQKVYKWTDAQGTVHYSQSAPAVGTRFKTITTTGSADSAASPARSSTTQAADAAPNTAYAAAESGKQQNRSDMCQSLSKNLSSLRGTSPVVMMRNGKPTALSADERKQQLDTAETQYQQYCATPAR